MLILFFPLFSQTVGGMPGLSKWDYCGTGPDYCGDGCQSGPCTSNGGQSGSGGNSGDIMNDRNFQCAFNDLDDQTREQRLDGLRNSGYTPLNADEAAVFLGHVYHETVGLSTLTESCAPGCGPNYAQSWCSIQDAPGQLYYGRGWFQLSYPCNYYAAGQSLGLDLLNNPDMVSQQQDVAVKTAVWFFQTNNMVGPARQGDFAKTTRILNGAQECNGGSEAANQQTRVATYERIRLCFGYEQHKYIKHYPLLRISKRKPSDEIRCWIETCYGSYSHPQDSFFSLARNIETLSWSLLFSTDQSYFRRALIGTAIC